jgi:hypothetical protein
MEQIPTTVTPSRKVLTQVLASIQEHNAEALKNLASAFRYGPITSAKRGLRWPRGSGPARMVSDPLGPNDQL